VTALDADRGTDASDVVDLAFSVRGDSVAADYAWQLRQSVRACLPWLEESGAGIHPLSGASISEGVLCLNRRARLVLRLTRRWVEAAQALAGSRFDLGGEIEIDGPGSLRPLQPSPVLYAVMVHVGCADEGEFVAACRRLAPVSPAAQLVCGKARSVTGPKETLRGYSVMLYGLSEEESLRLQGEGLGGQRQLGCGIFVPHKSVAAVGT
jgi:CRISPR-associated protein Cas6